MNVGRQRTVINSQSIMPEIKSVSRNVQLAKVIYESVVELERILSMQNAALPSFDEDAPFYLPRETSSIRDEILDATAELHNVLLGPMELILQQGAVSYREPTSKVQE
jgi:hypothetical protein